jgi:hypothetical protein
VLLPRSTKLEYKFIVTRQSGAVDWSPGFNYKFTVCNMSCISNELGVGRPAGRTQPLTRHMLNMCCTGHCSPRGHHGDSGFMGR